MIATSSVASGFAVSRFGLSRVWTHARAVLLAAAVCLLAAGCTGGAPTQTGSQAFSSSAAGKAAASTSATLAPLVKLAVFPTDRSTGVDPTAPVRVSVVNGTITTVTLRAPDGFSVPGTLTTDGSSWVSTAPRLLYDTGYKVVVHAKQGSTPVTLSSAFTTLAPKQLMSVVSVLPLAGWTVGTAMPVVLRLSADVPPAQRAAVEAAVHVVGTAPDGHTVAGKFLWLSPTELHWRPSVLWPVGTKVHIATDFDGRNLGAGVWGLGTGSESFSIFGSDHKIVVDLVKDTLTSWRNGKVEKVFPVTGGKPGWDTRSGNKVVIAKLPVVTMDAASLRIPKGTADYYNLTVKFALRMTWSGEFLHAAPWSVASQGKSNVSHGCVGMSTVNAQWLFNNTRVGDLVQVTGTERSLEPGNGWTDWNL